jgi:hypothetical protein
MKKKGFGMQNKKITELESFFFAVTLFGLYLQPESEME